MVRCGLFLSNSHLTLILNSNVGGIDLSFQMMAIMLYLAIAHPFINAEEVVGVLEWRRSEIDPAVGCNPRGGVHQ